MMGAAEINSYSDESKIRAGTPYGGLYDVCTDLLDDDISAILKVRGRRGPIEEYLDAMITLKYVSLSPPVSSAVNFFKACPGASHN